MPDIIHAHGMLNGGLLAAKLGARHGLPFVLTEHSSAFLRGHVRPWQFQLASEALSKADALIAVSERFARQLSDFYGAGSPCWKYVPNLVDDAFLDAPLGGNHDGAGFRLCNVASLTGIKDHATLIEGFAEAFRGRAECSLTIAGEGPLRGEITALVDRLGVRGQVHLVGQLSRSEVRQLIGASNVFVLSSRIETFGVAVIEALALGVPVIATRCGGPESTVSDEDGLLVPPNSPAAMSRAMLEIAQRQDEMQSSSIRERCRMRFSAEAVTSRLVEIYRSAIAGFAARSGHAT